MQESNRTKRKERLSDKEKLYLLDEFFSVKPVRGLRRMSRRSNDAIRRFFRLAGRAAAEYQGAQKNLPVRRILIDEMHVLIGGRDKNLSEYSKERLGWGERWLWVAIDGDTGFILATHLAKRGVRDAIRIMQKVHAKLPQQEDGTLCYKPTIITDGNRDYVDAVERVFGDDCNFAQYVKQYTQKRDGKELPGLDENGELKPGARFKEGVRKTIVGEVPEEEIITSRVEGTMSLFRRLLPRFDRRSPRYSKSHERAEDAIALGVFYINYMKQRETRKPAPLKGGKRQLTRGGNPKKETVWLPPPAVELRVPKRPNGRIQNLETDLALWEPAQLVTYIAQYEFREKISLNEARAANARSLAADTTRRQVTENIAPYEYVVLWNKIQHYAKIHRSDCDAASSAAGKIGQPGRTSEWFGHASLESARTHAERLIPHGVEECRKCLGQYQTLGRRL